MKEQIIENIIELIKINPTEIIEINPNYLQYFDIEDAYYASACSKNKEKSEGLPYD